MQMSYPYFKIIQSECCIYWIWHSDWMVCEYEYKARKSYDDKDWWLIGDVMDVLYHTG
jgi:hypothetical protein